MTNTVRDKTPAKKTVPTPRRSLKERLIEQLIRPPVLAAAIGGICTILAAIISLLKD